MLGIGWKEKVFVFKEFIGYSWNRKVKRKIVIKCDKYYIKVYKKGVI